MLVASDYSSKTDTFNFLSYCSSACAVLVTKYVFGVFDVEEDEQTSEGMKKEEVKEEGKEEELEEAQEDVEVQEG